MRILLIEDEKLAASRLKRRLVQGSEQDVLVSREKVTYFKEWLDQ